MAERDWFESDAMWCVLPIFVGAVLGLLRRPRSWRPVTIVAFALLWGASGVLIEWGEGHLSIVMSNRETRHELRMVEVLEEQSLGDTIGRRGVVRFTVRDRTAGAGERYLTLVDAFVLYPKTALNAFVIGGLWMSCLSIGAKIIVGHWRRTPDE